MIHPDPARIIVPRKHGEVLIEPSLAAQADALRCASEEGFNQVLVSAFGSDLVKLRAAARESLYQVAIAWARKTDRQSPPVDIAHRPLIFTGHQVEFYHAGVWAKVIVADALARQVPGGVAFDLLVDHDVVDELGFAVPVEENPPSGSWARRAVTFGESTSLSADSLRAPGLLDFESWDASLARYPASNTDSLALLLSRLRSGLDNSLPYAAWMSAARATLEASLGLEVYHLPTSLICTSESWFVFVRAWIAHASDWMTAYNRHLASYRKRHGIHNPQHPMPDLSRFTPSHPVEIFELPFWIYRSGETRQRLMIAKSPNQTLVQLAEGSLDVSGGLSPVTEAGYHIRPRALTLTMFTRLFLADLFIHGIGGALYDQISDGLMLELFGVAPSYSCVSAAWLLPLGEAANLEDVSELRWRRHHLAHNPQQALDPFTALRTDIAELIRDRRDLIQNIVASLQSAKTDPAAHSRRRAWFDELHTTNLRLHEKSPQILARLDRQIEQAVKALEQNKVLLWREYFFALHSIESLQRLISAIRAS